MAQVIIDIPNNQVTRINEAFADLYGWSSELGVTKTQFAKAKIIDYIRSTVKSSEGNIQERSARQTVDVDSITIT